MVYTIIWFKKYRVIRQLGSGATSGVFLVYHEKLDCYRAIKRIAKDTYGEPLRKEAFILKSLRHSNIPIIYDMEEDESYLYIIEEYLEGQSLRAFRLSHSFIGEDDIKAIAIQLCEVLHYLHFLEKPILYLDLKPDNILIEENSGTVKLIDFGAALLKKEGDIPDFSFGTKGYAAPEQYKTGYLDIRSDIYGLGSILYFLYTGKAFYGKREELDDLNKITDCSKKMQKVIRKCLQYLPSRRYQSVDEVQKEVIMKTVKKTPLIITVAGTLPGIGVTHISLMISSYFRSIGRPVLYLEQSEDRVIEKIILYEQHPPDFPIMRGSLLEAQNRYPRIEIVVCNCGIFSEGEENFRIGNLKYLVCGSKPWEWVIPSVPFEVFYLYNFTDKKDFLILSKSYPLEKMVWVPFEYHYGYPHKNKQVITFMREILGDAAEKKK